MSGYGIKLPKVKNIVILFIQDEEETYRNGNFSNLRAESILKQQENKMRKTYNHC